jgi:hypothetical protein
LDLLRTRTCKDHIHFDLVTVGTEVDEYVLQLVLANGSSEKQEERE